MAARPVSVTMGKHNGKPRNNGLKVGTALANRHKKVSPAGPPVFEWLAKQTSIPVESTRLQGW